jgi:hypothetical protein
MASCYPLRILILHTRLIVSEGKIPLQQGPEVPTTFPAGEAKNLSRSASAGSEA